MLGVGAIIGTGIFVLTGQAAAANAGSGHRAVDGPGGADERARRAVLFGVCGERSGRGLRLHLRLCDAGEFVAWIIGWDLILEYALGAATVAVGWSGNLVTLLGQLGLSFPAALSAAPGTAVAVAGGDPGDGGL